MYYCKRVINICLFKRKSIVEKFNGESKKVSNQLFNIYISKNDNDPKGIIIEKRDINYLDDKKTTDYVVIYENLNSSIIFLRSILIKLFFSFYTNQKCYPLHCSAIRHKNRGYLFLADSLGGKSTLYFTFAVYGSSKGYELLTDDTILCKLQNNDVLGYTMPLKPSLRKGTIDYLKPMEVFLNLFDKSSYRIDDQIYVDIKDISDSKVVLSSDINVAFFIHFSNSFSIEEWKDKKMIKRQLAFIICGYKATPVDSCMIDFLNSFVDAMCFYKLYIPPQMADFFYEFEKWEESKEKNGEKNNKK